MAVAGFGSVSVEIVGLESYPSSSYPTLIGYRNRQEVWRWVFPREQMFTAWSVYFSFWEMSSEASRGTTQPTRSPDDQRKLQQARQGIGAFENFFNQHVQALQQRDPVPDDEVQQTQGVLEQLNTLKKKLGS